MKSLMLWLKTPFTGHSKTTKSSQKKNGLGRLKKNNSNFSPLRARNAQEMRHHEAILLDLVSKYLKKRITLIPFLEGDQEQSF
jgi:hypothetical protein